MFKMNVDIEENDADELRKLPGTMAEHVRQAIKNYLKRKLRASTSPTRKK